MCTRVRACVCVCYLIGNENCSWDHHEQRDIHPCLEGCCEEYSQVLKYEYMLEGDMLSYSNGKAIRANY